MINYLMQNVTLAGWAVCQEGDRIGEPDATSNHGACNGLVRNPVQNGESGRPGGPFAAILKRRPIYICQPYTAIVDFARGEELQTKR